LAADSIDDLGQRADSRGHGVELATAVVGDDDAVNARLDRPPCVLRVEDPLHEQPPAPVLTDPGDVIPGDAGVELGVHPLLEGVGRARARDRVLEVAEREWLAADADLAYPPRMQQQ